MERRKLLAERFYNRMAKCLEVAMAKWERRTIEDPAYQPSPSDIVGMMKALREAEETIAHHGVLDQYLAKAKAEMKRLEDSMFNLLATDPDAG